MSQTQKAQVYEKHELEKMLRKLSEKVGYLAELLERAERSIREIHYVLYFKTDVNVKTIDEIAELFRELRDRIYDAVDEMIVRELQLDVDIDKYEKQYNVKFGYTEERLLGVALVAEGGKVKPVAVWTDYEVVGYYEGDRSE